MIKAQEVDRYVREGGLEWNFDPVRGIYTSATGAEYKVEFIEKKGFGVVEGSTVPILKKIKVFVREDKSLEEVVKHTVHETVHVDNIRRCLLTRALGTTAGYLVPYFLDSSYNKEFGHSMSRRSFLISSASFILAGSLGGWLTDELITDYQTDKTMEKLKEAHKNKMKHKEK